MPEQENIQHPGDVSVDKLTITVSSGAVYTLEQGEATEIILYESIFSYGLFGTITIADSKNMIGEWPIVGGEVLTMKIRTKTFPDDPGLIIHKSFQIYGITDRGTLNDREQTYVLQFCSLEVIADTPSPIYRAFPGTDAKSFNTADIAVHIYEEYIAKETPRIFDKKKSRTGLILGGDHSSEVQYVSNGWTPSQNMNFLCKRITDGENDTQCDNVFYESNKSWYLTSIQQLIGTQRDAKFDEYIFGSNPQKQRVGEYNAIDLSSQGFNTIEEMNIPRTIDIIDNSMNGYYASNVVGYDVFTKTMSNIAFDIENDFDSQIHTDNNVPMPEHIRRNPGAKTTAKMLNSSVYYGMVGGIYDKGSQASSPTHMTGSSTRTTYFNSFNDYTIEIDVPGRTDIQCGVLIYVKYPRPKSKSGDDVYLEDNIMTGNYLVTSISHKITAAGHSMKMEIIKNGLQEKLGKT